MSTEAFNCIFKNYPETVQMSDAQKKKYILKGKSLNKTQQKLLNQGILEWKERGVNTAKGLYLFHGDPVNEFVVKNPKVAGTPKIKPINGQVFWESGSGGEWDRKAIKDYLRTWFVPGIVRQLPEKIFAPKEHFIQIEYLFYYPFDTNLMYKYQDILNHAYVRSKVFEDILVEMEIIKDDNPTFVRGAYGRYIDIPIGEERRLEVKIHFCKNNQRIS